MLPYLKRPYWAKNLVEKNVFSITGFARRSVKCTCSIIWAKWQTLLKRIETDECTTTSVSKTLCSLHKFILEHEGPDSNYFSRRTMAVHSRPPQHPFWITAPNRQGNVSDLLVLYQCDICVMAKWLWFASKCYTTPAHAFAWQTFGLIVMNYYVQSQCNSSDWLV